MALRKPDYAGSWYPASPEQCRREIERYEERARELSVTPDETVGGIVPHAGWYYSGEVACAVLKSIARWSSPETVVIFGMHLGPASDHVIMAEGAWETPLGILEIDEVLSRELTESFDFVEETPSFYEPDNTIEVQLPFVKYFFPESRILPVGVAPRAEALEIGERVADLLAKREGQGVVVGSTDLTHYGPNYGFAPRGTGEKAVEWVRNNNDKRMTDLMVQMNPSAMLQEARSSRNACCVGAAAAAVAAVKRLGCRAGELLVYRTSYDIEPSTSFVGYAGVVYYR
ncbi:MAG: AmmeMemoRadiSam system protein B [Deltaproteobacteria bacterium]|nr:AmmeMemoRadiSam system protein B [Deltaproteobacteria bacterium]MBW2120698.1 AmmeMemoRadiSam system protein B [Deltaproteobacteria bacterium]